MSGELGQEQNDVRGLIQVVRQLAEDAGAGDGHGDREGGIGGFNRANNGYKGCNHRHAGWSEIKPNKLVDGDRA